MLPTRGPAEGVGAMRRCVLSLGVAAVLLAGCATSTGITSEEEGRLVDACVAQVPAGAAGTCPALVDLLVTRADEQGCGYREAARGLRVALQGEDADAADAATGDC